MLMRLLLIAVVAILPALGIEAYNAYALREQRIEDIRRQALRDAEAVSRELDRFTAGLRDTLLLIANSQEIRAPDLGVCSRFLRDADASLEVFNSLSLTNAAGRVICSSITPEPLGNDISDRFAYQLAVQHGDFAIGNVVQGKGSGTQQLNMGFPVRRADGALLGVLIAGVDLGWLNRELQKIPLSPNGTLTIVDRTGTMLGRFPEADVSGTGMRDDFRWMLDAPKPGVIELTGRDGVPRFAGYLPSGKSADGLFVAVALSETDAFAPVEAAAIRSLSLSGLGLLLAVMAAVATGRRFITRPIDGLLAAAREWHEGDRGARVETRTMPDEFARIGEAFNLLVSEIDRNETAARRRLQEISSIYDSAPVGLALVDRDLRYLSANARLYELDHRNNEDRVGRTIREIVPHLADQLEPIYRKVLTTGEPVHNIEFTAPFDISRTWLANYHPVKSDDGEVVAVSVALLETTDLRSTQTALARSEERMKLAQEAAGIGVWDWDLATGQVRWSPQQFALHGLEPQDEEKIFTYVEWYSAVHLEDRQAMHIAMGAALAKGKKRYEVDYRIRDPETGELRWLATRGHVVSSSPGQPIRVVGVSFDISERRRAEELLEKANADLEQRVAERTSQLVNEIKGRELAQAQLFQAQKTEALGQLTGGIAHDFNNLLAAVLGSLELLKKRLPPEPRLQRLIENAYKGAERGAVLTQRMLAFARKQDLKPQSVNVADLVAGMNDLLQRSIGPLVRIRMNFPTDLPNVRVDPHQLELALLNLAVNGRDAMPNGGVLSFEADEQRSSDSPSDSARYVRLCIRDTGTGMDEATLARATEPFFTTKGVGKGTGLGLSMVQGLVGQSGGRLALASKLGLGTTVEIWLPVSEAAADGGLVKMTDAMSNQEHANRLTVLVVDDDPLVLMGTVDMVEDLGHKVIEASSGAEALEKLQGAARIDVLLTDQAMPGMTGVQLASRVIAARPDIPVILATGYADLPKDAPPSIRRLGKPFSQSELAHLLNECAGKVESNVVPFRPAS